MITACHRAIHTSPRERASEARPAHVITCETTGRRCCSSLHGVCPVCLIPGQADPLVSGSIDLKGLAEEILLLC